MQRLKVNLFSLYLDQKLFVLNLQYVLQSLVSCQAGCVLSPHIQFIDLDLMTKLLCKNYGSILEKMFILYDSLLILLGIFTN